MELRECDVLAEGAGKKYKFSGTLGAMETVCHFGRDITKVHKSLGDGEIVPSDIKNILWACLATVDGKDVENSNSEAFAVEMVEDFGLQECAVLCQMLIHHALIGNVKKKQMRLSEPAIGMIMRTKTILSANSRKLGLALVVASLISVALVCTSSKFF